MRLNVRSLGALITVLAVASALATCNHDWNRFRPSASDGGVDGSGADADADADDAEAVVDADEDGTPDSDVESDEQCGDQPDFTPCVAVTDTDRSYNICIDGVCRSPGCGDTTCNPAGPSFTLADTGQLSCYGDTCAGIAGGDLCGSNWGCGQDAQYGWDKMHENSDRYATSAPEDGFLVVFDTVTGLEWQGCALGLSGTSCRSGEASSMTWSEAIVACDELAWSGHSDWHLPDVYELSSILNCEVDHPSIDGDAFPGTPIMRFWTISTFAQSSDDTSYAWKVDFDTGDVDNSPKDSTYGIRCVRNPYGFTKLTPRFTRAGSEEPVVTDTWTGLEWQGCPAGRFGEPCDNGEAEAYEWYTALSHCENLLWGGSNDWRLPNVRELASLIDTRRRDPTIDSAVFPHTPSHIFFTSSFYAATPLQAWGVDFENGHIENTGSLNLPRVRCVRAFP